MWLHALLPLLERIMDISFIKIALRFWLITGNLNKYSNILIIHLLLSVCAYVCVCQRERWFCGKMYFLLALVLFLNTSHNLLASSRVIYIFLGRGKKCISLRGTRLRSVWLPNKISKVPFKEMLFKKPLVIMVVQIWVLTQAFMARRIWVLFQPTDVCWSCSAYISAKGGVLWRQVLIGSSEIFVK